MEAKNLQPSSIQSSWIAKGNRIYTADDREVAVATKADPLLRARAEVTAAEIAARWNAHDELVAALDNLVHLVGMQQRIEAARGTDDPRAWDPALDAAKAALAKVSA